MEVSVLISPKELRQPSMGSYNSDGLELLVLDNENSQDPTKHSSSMPHILLDVNQPKNFVAPLVCVCSLQQFCLLVLILFLVGRRVPAIEQRVISNR